MPDASEYSDDTIDALNIDLPEGGGFSGYGETFNTDKFTGTAQITIPVFASEARALTPNLKLKYTSGAGNGLFGQGWSLELPSFRLRTDKGIPRYDGTDTVLAPSGQVLTPDLETHSRTRNEHVGGVDYQVDAFYPRHEKSFDRIERWTDTLTGISFWKVVDAENVTSIYGNTAQTRISAPGAASRIYQWSLHEVRDALGNRVVYRYESAHNALYPKEIRYGNYRTSDGDEAYALALHFAYAKPTGAPPVLTDTVEPRIDAFSSFRSGFEIHTDRLCRAIMAVHRFEKDQIKPEQVVSVTQFDYEEADGPSRLVRAQRTGWRTKSDGSAYSKSLPPLDLTYTRWTPDRAYFAPLETPQGAVPMPIGGRNQLVDLFGEGRPGILVNQPPDLTYWGPRDGGELSCGRVPAPFPVNRPGSRAALTDVAGNGHLDLMVTAPDQAGFYRNHNDGSWSRFTPFRSVPLDLADPASRLVDLSGNGQSDLLSGSVRDWRVALSSGDDGFENVLVTTPPEGTTLFQSEDASVFIGFADFFGDGLQHLVRIADGAVSVWPNLGYGRFGARREIPGAPLLEDDVTASRILLADVGGDGAADLIIVGAREVKLYRNQFGASLAEPISVAIPSGFNLIDHATAADVFGRGASAIVVSQNMPEVANLVLDFTCGARPYFLCAFDNNMGARTEISYRSSTDYYLADKAAGFDWVSRLAFPVQVVERTQAFDDVAKSSLTRVFQYRDGFFDPVERQFQGFGYVQTQDFPAYDTALWHFPQARPATTPDDQPVEPQLVRSWRLTGASLRQGAIARQLETLAWSKDPEALKLEPYVLDPALDGADGETLRQAHHALAGQVMRTETFGIDANGKCAAAPYQVEENQALVRLIQPINGRHAAVFNVLEQAQTQLIYDQDATDPRTELTSVLSHDRFGHPLRVAKVAFPRRRKVISPQRQNETHLTLQTYGVINLVDGRYENASGGPRPAHHGTAGGTSTHLLGKPFEEQVFELAGVPKPASYYSHRQLIDIADEALSNLLPYGVPFPPNPKSPRARVFHWKKTLYWDEGQSAPLELQRIAPTALVASTPVAQSSQDLADKIYGHLVSHAQIEQHTGNTLSEDYWWSPGLVQHFYGPDLYHMASATVDPFGAAMEMDYDRYVLAPVTLTDPLGAKRVAAQDYQALSPAEVTDVNENHHTYLYDPLGLLIVSTVTGDYAGQRTGNEPISSYKLIEAPSSQDVLKDPERFLQGASTFFCYDLQAWTGADNLPPHTIEISRQDYVHGSGGSLKPTERPDYAVDLNFFDGFGRKLAEVELVHGTAPLALTQADRATRGAALWRVQNQKRYDDRGTPTRRYQPYFSPVPAVELLPDQPHWRVRYDALYREIGTTTPRGFLTATVHGPWQTELWDADDTVTQSPFYRKHYDDPDLPASEKRALELATVFENTPGTQILDPQGRAIQELQLLVEGDGTTPAPIAQPQYAASWLDAAGQTVAFADARFCEANGPDAPSFYNLGAQYDMVGQVMALRSADAGDVALATPGDGTPAVKLFDFSGKPVMDWDRRGFKRTLFFDALRQPVHTYVEGPGLDQIVERIRYGSDPAHNTVHKPVALYDQAGLRRTAGYDLDENPCAQSVQYREHFAGEPDWTDPSAVPLQSDIYEIESAYSAQSQLLAQRFYNGAVLNHRLTRNGWVEALSLAPDAHTAALDVIPLLTYTPDGAPHTIALGTGAVSRFTYDHDTRRLHTLVTETTSLGEVVQDLTYTYDPFGNVVEIADPLAVPGTTGDAKGSARYTYDSLYRLRTATGREIPKGGDEPVRYFQRFGYDASGNLEETSHKGGDSWTRTQVVSDSSNHAVPKSLALGGPSTVDSFFDADGLLTQLPGGTKLGYDEVRRLVHAQFAAGAPAKEAHYQYDTDGIRARKTSVGTSATQTLYMGALIIPDQSKDECELQLRTGNSTVALVRMVGKGGGTPVKLEPRYPLSSRTSSVTTELSDHGVVLRHQEYFPFGDTALDVQVDKTAGDEAVRFQFSGKERDTGTGLYYFGQRYYIPSQGRWSTPDPTGTADGPNLFAYVGNNPLTLIDPAGTCGDTPKPTPPKQTPLDRMKRAFKTVNTGGVIINALAEGIGASLGHDFMPANMRDMPRAVGLLKLTSLAGFGGVVGGAAGMGYYAADIKKYGANPYNVASFTGNAFFALEGGLIYRSFLAVGHHAVHAAHMRIGLVGAVADTLKIPKEIRDGNYLNATVYATLAAANARAAVPDKVFYSGTEKFFHMAFSVYERVGAQQRVPISASVKEIVVGSVKSVKAPHLLITAVALKAFDLAKNATKSLEDQH